MCDELLIDPEETQDDKKKKDDLESDEMKMFISEDQEGLTKVL